MCGEDKLHLCPQELLKTQLVLPQLQDPIFYRRRNCGSDRLSHLLKIAQSFEMKHHPCSILLKSRCNRDKGHSNCHACLECGPVPSVSTTSGLDPVLRLGLKLVNIIVLKWTQNCESIITIRNSKMGRAAKSMGDIGWGVTNLHSSQK